MCVKRLYLLKVGHRPMKKRDIKRDIFKVGHFRELPIYDMMFSMQNITKM